MILIFISASAVDVNVMIRLPSLNSASVISWLNSKSWIFLFVILWVPINGFGFPAIVGVIVYGKFAPILAKSSDVIGLEIELSMVVSTISTL